MFLIMRAPCDVAGTAQDPAGCEITNFGKNLRQFMQSNWCAPHGGRGRLSTTPEKLAAVESAVDDYRDARSAASGSNRFSTLRSAKL